MAAQTEQSLYMGEFADPLVAQQAFADSFDLDNPRQAAADYAKIMKAHTQRQLQSITRSSRRSLHTGDGAPATATLSPESSTTSTTPEE